MGIPVAQNAGLEAAKGDLYVNFNDDFQAAPDFLSELVRAYADLDKPVGIGGVVVKSASGKTKGFTANYIEAIRDGAAPSTTDIGPAFLPSAVKRLLTYVVSNFSVKKYVANGTLDHQEVVELYGANASFPIAMLRQIGGWDASTAAPAIGGIEDRDICFRLRQQFPDHHFYIVRSARLMLDLDSRDSAVTVKSFLLRPYRRGPFNYVFHIKYGLTPPLFPFPPLILLILLAAGALAPLLVPLLIVLLPQLCYGWWLSRMLIERRPMYLLFPYVQLAEETMVMIGLVRGFIMRTQRRLA